MAEYTQGICQDGAAILKDGQMMTIEEILGELNNHERLVSALDSAATVLEIAGYVDTAKNHRALLAKLEAGKGGE